MVGKEKSKYRGMLVSFEVYVDSDIKGVEDYSREDHKTQKYKSKLGMIKTWTDIS